MTDGQLQQLVSQISLHDFKRPFRHRAYFNARLRTTGGRYQLESHNIDINPKMLTDFDEKTLVGVIKHELCHYHLHLTQRGYQHRDADFKRLLAQVGGSRYAPTPKKQTRLAYRYTYQCQRCGLVYHRKRRLDTQRYTCGRCRGPIKPV
ncbi:SprT family protein [Lactiplantibacillus sp. WILCCON 0030]|uniref:Protein SprT-like n=1 Tax=Lactiplantibacillus brownii TaxID=3069269 RepID=A0ABU1A709_9LACO|nr:SprT family protein [Lactiplantibacillus brownii]MDQ7936465.1 SprT family protein [Lactiplantibacillus brownii]